MGFHLVKRQTSTKSYPRECTVSNSSVLQKERIRVLDEAQRDQEGQPEE